VDVEGESLDAVALEVLDQLVDLVVADDAFLDRTLDEGRPELQVVVDVAGVLVTQKRRDLLFEHVGVVHPLEDDRVVELRRGVERVPRVRLPEAPGQAVPGRGPYSGVDCRRS